MRPTRRTPEQIARAFLSPRRPDAARAMERLPPAQPFTADGPCGKVACRWLGDGPCVVLLHGWEGSPGDFSTCIPPLLAAGLSVLALDLPAHGDSDGELVSIPLAAEALLAVQHSLGPEQRFHGGLAHSLGASIVVQAMTQGLRIERVALVAAPAHAVDYARDYCLREGLGADETEAVLDLLHRQYGVDLRAISMPVQAATLTQPALFVHSDDDRVVPLADSRLSASAWRGAQHVTVTGLGHARLLRDAAVAQHMAEFLRRG